MRIFNSIEHYGLDITRAVLSGGASLAPYLQAFNVSLFLSLHEDDVQAAVNSGVASALLYQKPENARHRSRQRQSREFMGALTRLQESWPPARLPNRATC